VLISQQRFGFYKPIRCCGNVPSEPLFSNGRLCGASLTAHGVQTSYHNINIHVSIFFLQRFGLYKPIRCCGNMPSEPLFSNGRLCGASLTAHGVQASYDNINIHESIFFLQRFGLYKPIRCCGNMPSEPLSSNGRLCGAPLTAHGVQASYHNINIHEAIFFLPVIFLHPSNLVCRKEITDFEEFPRRKCRGRYSVD
jgi:hypothetical protein